MRRLLFLVPLALVGCKPGRQTSVSTVGSVASTADGGTFVAGRGRVAEGGSDVAWSPDGGTLAIAAKDGVLVWPKADRVPGMTAPLAWSPLGDALAGVVDGKVVVWRAGTGGSRETTLRGTPSAVRWTADGRPFAVDALGVQIDGGPRLTVKGGDCDDAVAAPGGEIVTLQWGGLRKTLSAALKEPVKVGRLDPANGSFSTVSLGPGGDLFGAASPRRVTVPLRLVLAPNGTSVAVSGLRLEAGARSLARLRALADKAQTTKAEEKEADTLLKSARLTSVVVRVTLDGRSRTLWSRPQTLDEGGPTDLAWSPDGHWLAIASRDGTVRVAAE